MNVTLSIDPELLKEARKVALEKDTSVNALIRGYLHELVQEDREKRNSFLNEWEQLMNTNTIPMNEREWDRDSLHSRDKNG